MDVFYITMFFIFGIILASFLTVVGIRLPRGEDFTKGRSHCETCNNILKWYELFPIISYIIQLGKCRHCKTKIDFKYFIYELFTGILFSISYIVFGFSIELLISIVLICVLLVVIVSDIEYMIIPDEILILGSILLLLLNTMKDGIYGLAFSVINGIIAFCIMYVIKMLGDFLFKKESLGGGDIKLIGMLGILFNYQSIIATIFLGSILALPYALFVTFLKKDNIIPFGPFLSIGAIIIFISKLNNLNILDVIYNLI